MNLKNPVLIGFGIRDKSSFSKACSLCQWSHYRNCIYQSSGKCETEEIPVPIQGFYQFPEMKIVIIKYNAGNIQSVLFALERIGAEALVTDDPEIIRSADKIIFPGVGEASSAMDYLRERKLDLLIQRFEATSAGHLPGYAAVCTHSEENDTKCLGIFSETVKKFNPVAEANAQSATNRMEQYL